MNDTMDWSRLEYLLDREVVRLYLRVFLTGDADVLANMDIGLVLDIEDEGCYLFGSTQPDDGWSIGVQQVARPQAEVWADFEGALSALPPREGERGGGHRYAYYDVTDNPSFARFSGVQLTAVDVLRLDQHDEPFALILTFTTGNLLICTHVSGSTVQSDGFNVDVNPLANFQRLGAIYSTQLSKRMTSDRVLPISKPLIAGLILSTIAVGWMISSGTPWWAILLKTLAMPVR